MVQKEDTHESEDSANLATSEEADDSVPSEEVANISIE